jgi:succinoglycan biosynthesis protein ExoA
MPELPLISILVPCYNEQATISLLLEAVWQQTFPAEQLEVIIADGMSTDGTRQAIGDFAGTHPQLTIQVVDNPHRIIPAGLNLAIEAARGTVLLRLDAHSIPRPDYVQRCVTALQEDRGDNVGGIWEIQAGGPGWMARGIAAAASHPLGVGDARYRYTDQAGLVDTVPFGAFRRDLITRIGLFDESLLTNEDYEFNARLRLSGGRVWLDPQIRSIYFARSNLPALLRQYWRYGYWKLRMLRRYPGTLRWRQALPPAFVGGLLLCLPLGLWQPVFFVFFLLAMLAYTLILMLAGLQAANRRNDAGLALGMPLAISAMHFAWGSGFLWSLISLPFSGAKSSSVAQFKQDGLE